jgi:hypothetical protein
MSQLSELARKFPKSHIQSKPGSYNAPYVDHAVINQRLLQVVGPFDWDVREFIMSTEGQIVGCVGTLSCEIDGRRVTVSEVGDVANPTAANGQNAQIASSQAFKRCAMRIGLGLHLWSGDRYFLDKPTGESSRTQST